MTTLATSLIGAAVGGVVGAPGMGFSLGAALGQSFLGGRSGQHSYTHQEGSRLSDLKVQSSQVGMMIPIVYGTYRIAGNLIWATDIVEHSNTTTQTQHLGGGGKGGHHHDNVVTQTATTYTYSANFALGLCQGVILGIRRIWADGKLIYNTSSTATTQTLMGSQLRAKQLRLYTGTEDQLPDPLIEAHLGAGKVPAFRSLAYLVFEELQLAEFGNRLPNITIEVVQVGEHVRNLSHVAIQVEKPLTDAVGQLSRFDGGVIHTKVGGEGWRTAPERVDVDLNLKVIQRFRGANTQPGCIYQPLIKYMPNVFLKSTPPCLWYDVVTGQHAPIEPYIGTPLMGVYANGHVYCSYGSREGTALHLIHYLVASPYELPKQVISRIHEVNPRFGQPQTQLLDMDMQQGYLFALLKEHQTLKLLAFDPLSRTLIKKWELKLAEKKPPALHLLDRSQPNYHLSLNSDSTAVLVTYHDGNRSQAYLVPLDFHADTLYADPNETYTFEGIGNFCFLSHDIMYVGGLSSTLKTTQASIRGVHAIEPVPLLLTEVIKHLCQKVNIPSEGIDLSKLQANPQEITGFVLSQACCLRDALLPLQQAYPFDIVESGFKLHFMPRGIEKPIEIHPQEVSAQEVGQTASNPWIETHSQAAELPQSLHLLFANLATDYQQGHHCARRSVTSSPQAQTIELPLALTDQQAAHIADSLLYEAWTGRTHTEFTLPRKYVFLDPGDVIHLNDKILRLTSVAYGDPGLIKIKAVPEDAAIYQPVPVSEPSLVDSHPIQEIPLPSPTQLYLLDMPILHDEEDDTGFYVSISRLLPHWPGAVVAQSIDKGQTFKALYSQTHAATVGITQNVLLPAKTTVFDEDSFLLVKLTTGELSSATELNVLNGENSGLVGQELLQFQNAVLQPDGSYRLRRFLRGRRGTEWAVNTHQVSEIFILIDPATLHRVKSPAAEIGLSRIYKAMTFGRSLAASTPYTFVNTAVGKKPLSSVHLQGSRNAAGDLILTWIPRTRIQGAWRDGVDAPRDPEITGYEIDVIKEQAVVRTLKSTTEIVTYTAEQQIMDLGSLPKTITLKLYAIGRTVGRGFPTEATL